ncbi:MAG: hypothetical protein LC126_24845 [Bryobacterales bacterium]|nr:hypothetical protein [Bryobacterales bacterium]
MPPLVPPAIAALHPYLPGLSAAEVSRAYGVSEVIKLASNENPLGPSPLAVEAIHRSLGNLHLYPSGGLELREVLSRRHRTKTGNAESRCLRNGMKYPCITRAAIKTSSGPVRTCGSRHLPSASITSWNLRR